MKELIKKKIKDIKHIRFLSYFVLFDSIVFYVLFCLFLSFTIFINNYVDYSFAITITILFWIFLFLWLVSGVILIIKLFIYNDEKETNSKLRLIAAILMIFISFIASILSIVWSKREQEYHEKNLFSLDTNTLRTNSSNSNDINSSINNVLKNKN